MFCLYLSIQVFFSTPMMYFRIIMIFDTVFVPKNQEKNEMMINIPQRHREDYYYWVDPWHHHIVTNTKYERKMRKYFNIRNMTVHILKQTNSHCSILKYNFQKTVHSKSHRVFKPKTPLNVSPFKNTNFKRNSPNSLTLCSHHSFKLKIHCKISKN